MSTAMQREVNAIDLELSRLEDRVARIDPQPTQSERKEAFAAEGYIRMARAQIRLLMSDADRMRTKW